jgi:hypothetical protein
MGKAVTSIHAFNAGEASYAALARVDQETIKLTAERQENIIPYVVGKGMMRPGSKYLYPCATAPGNGATPVPPPFVIPFVRSVDETALIELYQDSAGAAWMSVYINDQIVSYPGANFTIQDPEFWEASEYWSPAGTGAGISQFTEGGVAIAAQANGGYCTLSQTVTTQSPNVLHCIAVSIGPGFAGAQSGNLVNPFTFTGAEDVYLGISSPGYSYDLFNLEAIPPGTHYIAFTPYSTEFTITFRANSQVPSVILGCSPVSPGPMKIPFSFPSEFVSTPNYFANTQYVQSLDVIFLTVGSWAQPMMIQKRSDYSWSIALYYCDDGPFQAEQSDDTIYFTPSGTSGEITITASAPYWSTSADVINRTLFQITHDSMNATFGIAGQNVSTPAFRVTGIQESGDRAWSATVSGTWSGTITVERSFDDEFSGFEAYIPNDTNDSGTAVTITANGTENINDADDNTIIWYRLTFTTYTSGVANINIKYGGYGYTGIARITNLLTPTQCQAEVITPFANTTASNLWLDGEWNFQRGWPSAVGLFDGRLWWAREDQFWGSVSDNYFSMAVQIPDPTSGTPTTTDASSIQRNIATGGAFDDVVYMLPLQRLIMGTSGAEVSVRSSSLDEPLTPTGITLRDCSSLGSAPVRPIKIDQRGIFVQRGTNKLFALVYNVYTSDYLPENLMRINEDIGYPANPAYGTTGFTQLVVQRQPDTWVWAVRSDGVLCGLLYEPAEKVQAWFRVTTGYAQGDRIMSVAVLPTQGEDQVYMVVERVLPSGSVYYIEKLQSHYNTLTRGWDAVNLVQVTSPGLYQVDAYIVSSGTNTTTSVSGINHLIGREVMALGWSVVRKTYGPLMNSSGGNTFTVDGTGSIQLGELAQNPITVGLPYTGYYKSSKLAYAAPQGNTALLQKKNVNNVGLLLQDTHPNALLIGTDFNGIESMDPMPRIEELQPVQTTGFLPRVYDEQMFPIANQWTTDSRVCIQINPGYAATLNAIVVEIETNLPS